jgi:outer membrane immunogenic protein
MKHAALLAATLSILATGGAADAAGAGAPYTWTGWYVGVQGGYSWTHSQSSYDDPTLALNFPIDPIDASGFSGGFEGGWNYQVNPNFVVGIEGDVSFANLTETIPDLAGSTLHSPGQTITSTTDFGANLRGRAGILVSAHTLLFGAAGLALSHATVTATDGNLSDQATLCGWTIGGGFEEAVTSTVSAKLEYLYSDTGKHTWYDGQAYSSTSTGTGNTLRAGINLHF